MNENEQKIQCTMDTAIEINSKCYWCCIHCDEKDTCEMCCELSKKCQTTEDVYRFDCLFAE